jgi:hypothetical protein
MKNNASQWALREKEKVPRVPEEILGKRGGGEGNLGETNRRPQPESVHFVLSLHGGEIMRCVSVKPNKNTR